MDVFVKDGDDYKPISSDYVVLKQDELKRDYVSKEDHKSGVEKAIEDRFSNHLHKDSAHENETVIARVLDAHKPKEDSADEDKIREQIFKAHVDPLTEKLEATEAKVGAYESRIKHNALSDLLTSKDVGFAPAFVKKVASDKPSMAELLLGDKFDLDDDQTLVAKGTNASAVDIAKELAADPSYEDFLAPDAKNRSSAGRPGQDASNGVQKTSLRQSDLDADAKAEYVEKHGYSTPKFEGAKPYKELAE